MNVLIPAPHGQLEAIHWPQPEARTAAVVCHPHPLHGGTMHNHVVFRIADAMRKAGIAVVRFNFRGVGQSTGSHGGGGPEREDVRAALDWMVARYPGLPLWVGGFSFGSVVGLTEGDADPRVTGLLGVGVPLVRGWDTEPVVRSRKPRALLCGTEDEFAPDVEAWFAELPKPVRTWAIPGADHLFNRERKVLDAMLAEAVAWLQENTVRKES